MSTVRDYTIEKYPSSTIQRVKSVSSELSNSSILLVQLIQPLTPQELTDLGTECALNIIPAKERVYL